MLVICTAIAGAAWIANEASRIWGQDMADALKLARVPQKVAADEMGLREPQLSDQLAARQPLNIYRFAELCERHPEVEIAFWKVRAERRGLCVMDRPELARLVNATALIAGRMLRRQPLKVTA